MFCSLNAEANISELKEFVLCKEKKELGDYRIGVYLLKKGVERQASFVAVLNNPRSANPILFSEIASFPLGLILVSGKNTPFPISCLDISGFADYDYDVGKNVDMALPVYETDNLIPGNVIY